MSKPTVLDRPTSGLPSLADALQIALAGACEQHAPAGASALFPVLADERFAEVFAPGATVRQTDLGAGLWAVLRSSSTARVLCVHNPTDQQLSFAPATELGTDDTPPLFLAGEVSTSGEEGAGLICQVAPRGYVWLARTGTAAPVTHNP